jgi:hypothetical protein
MIIKLKGGAMVAIKAEDESKIAYTPCYGCGKLIAFGLTVNGKNMPISKMGDGQWVSHFFDCPKAPRFRK